jgi:lipopolysaccharide/colanic/teichoic acid biosynthesis glycosyltransferase
MLKRLFDVVTSMAGLLVLLPLLVVIAILLATTSRGGILFRQERIGLDGRAFRLNKFRTMTYDKNAEEGTFTPGHNARVTPVGAVLRMTKLDELPQLWNVLVGDMSLVGPRPEVARWTKEYPERWKVVHSIRPGITDDASIEFRNEEQILADSPDPETCYRDVVLPRKLDLAEKYVRSHTFAGDLLILWRTVCAVFDGGEKHRNTSESSP